MKNGDADSDLETIDRATGLSSLLSCMFNDSFYHRNFGHKLLTLVTLLYAAISGFVLSSRSDSNPNNVNYTEFIFLSLFIALIGCAIIEQFFIIHKRVGFCFVVIYNIQKYFGFFKKGQYIDGINIVDLPEEYKLLIIHSELKKHGMLKKAFFSIGKRGYVSFVLYVTIYALIIYSMMIVISRHSVYSLAILTIALIHALYVCIRLIQKAKWTDESVRNELRKIREQETEHN